MRLEIAVDDSAQLDPFQMKYGTAGGLFEKMVLKPPPVTTLQMAFPSGIPKRMSSPFSSGPLHVVVVAFVLVLAQVRIAARTICVGVKLSTGGRPLGPGGPCGPVAPVSPLGPCGPVGPAGPVWPVSPFGP
jgi:hypothetical protein